MLCGFCSDLIEADKRAQLSKTLQVLAQTCRRTLVLTQKSLAAQKCMRMGQKTPTLSQNTLFGKPLEIFYDNNGDFMYDLHPRDKSRRVVGTYTGEDYESFSSTLACFAHTYFGYNPHRHLTVHSKPPREFTIGLHIESLDLRTLAKRNEGKLQPNSPAKIPSIC